MCQGKMIFRKRKMGKDEPEETVLSLLGLMKWIFCSIGSAFKRKK